MTNETPDTTPKEKGFTEDEAIALNAFRQGNPPAQSFSDASKFYSTDMIFTKLWKHLGQLSFSRADLYKWLEKNGYKKEVLADADTVWLIE